jgi:hypothetical protein
MLWYHFVTYPLPQSNFSGLLLNQSPQITYGGLVQASSFSLPVPMWSRVMVIVQIIMVPLCISCLGATRMLNRSTLQPSNPDRASVWPIGMNPNRAREQPMRTGLAARLSGVQVAEGECNMVINRIGGGPISHATLFWTTPPPPLKVEMARGVQNSPEHR